MPERRKRPVLKGIEHGLKGYRTGCGCEVCRKANNDYHAERRARIGHPRQTNNVVSIGGGGKKTAPVSNETPTTPGPMERAVIEECANISRAERFPTLREMATGQARIIDNKDLAGLHTSATRTLAAIMKDLRVEDDKATMKDKRKSGGRLASVQSLAKVKRAQ